MKRYEGAGRGKQQAGNSSGPGPRAPARPPGPGRRIIIIRHRARGLTTQMSVGPSVPISNQLPSLLCMCARGYITSGEELCVIGLEVISIL